MKKTIGVSVFLTAVYMILATTNAMAAPSRVFVTSTTYTGGGFGGLSGADAICNERAASASLGGTYTAWLSTSTVDAADRVYHNPDGYINTQNQVVADDWAALINGDNVDLKATIQYDENGNTITSVDYVWTGTDEDGTGTGLYCEDWTSSSSNDEGTAGLATDNGWYWSNYQDEDCDEPYRLYCFQDEPTDIPTMNEWGMIIFTFLLGLVSIYYLYSRKKDITA